MDKKLLRLIKDIFIFAAGNASSKIVLLLLMPLYTMKLSTAQYGVADSLTTLIELLVPIFTLSLSDAIFRFCVGEDVEGNGISFIIGIKFISWGFIAFGLISFVLSFFVGHLYAITLLLMFVAQALKTYFGCYLRGVGKSMQFAVSGFLGTLALVGFNLLFLLVFQSGLQGYLWSIVISTGISVLFMSLFVNPIRIIRQSKNVYKERYGERQKAMLNYCLPIIPNSISWWVNNAASKYLLLFICGESITGVFSAASKLPAVVNLLSAIFQQAWQYSSASEYNKANTSKFYSKVFTLYSIAIVFCCSLIIALNPIISSIVLKGEFFVAAKYVPLLLFAATLNCYSIFFGGLYTASKKSKMLMISTLVGAGINVLLSLVLIPYFQILGVIMASIASYFTVVIIRMIDSRKVVKIKFNYVTFILSILALFLQSLLSMLFANYHYFISLIFIIFIIICVFVDLMIMKRVQKSQDEEKRSA